MDRRASCPWVVALAAFALAAVPAGASAEHAWGYHWARVANPFTLQLGDNVASAWDTYLAEAANDWRASSVLETMVVAGGTTPRRCRPTAGRVEVCSYRYGFNGWLGLAQIWVSGTHITQAIVKLNDSYFGTPTYNTPAWRRLVVCQEVGHTLGLDHQDEEFSNPNLGTCMDYTSNPQGPPSNEHPNTHDYDQLEAIYAHLDSTSTVGNPAATRGMPPAMGQIEFDTPAQWGQLVRASRDGRLLLYVLDFGRGFRVFTFVIVA